MRFNWGNRENCSSCTRPTFGPVSDNNQSDTSDIQGFVFFKLRISQWACTIMLTNVFLFQDLLHVSEYDLLELGVHNHLHRLHLLTSLRLLQERERRKGTLVHAHTVAQSRPNSIFCLLRSSRFGSGAMFVWRSVFSCLSLGCGGLIAGLSCKDMLMPGGVWWWLGVVWSRTMLSHTHTHTQTFEHF